MNEEIYKKVKNNWDSLAKPIDGLGDFEDVICRIGAIEQSENPEISPAALIVFIADNGIIEEGVSQSDATVTLAVAKALAKGKSSVNYLADENNIMVLPVNIGMKYDCDFDGIVNKPVGNGTNNFKNMPAMTKNEMKEAFETGRECVIKLKESGVKLLLLGEMGIGNTTTSAACLSSLLKLKAEDVASFGAGLSGEGLNKKINIINECILKYDLYNQDTETVLCTVGGFDLAGLIGAIVEAKKQNMPIISDGLITGTAALLCHKMGYTDAADNVIFSHNGREKGIGIILDALNKKAFLNGNMALGEGTGAVLFYSCLKTAMALYNSGHVFKDLNMDPYARFT